jgi:hypothetical protein
MLIDRKAIPWVSACLAILLIATAFYLPYWRHSHGNMSGGSWPGLAFGAAGSIAMLVSMTLAARKRRYFETGKVSLWMQAHVWFGFISYPLILYHAGGFVWGGPLTQAIMWLFTFVMISGIFGLVLQNIIPTRLIRSTPAETIYDQIDHVLVKIREEANAIAKPILAQQSEALIQSGAGGVATLPATSLASAPFVPFYSGQILPFLAEEFRSRSPLARDPSSKAAFDQWRAELPKDLERAVDRLQSLVDERRQLHHQRRLHHWLHGWLLMHVPLSYLLIVLGAVHAVVAFRFTSPTP